MSLLLNGVTFSGRSLIGDGVEIPITDPHYANVSLLLHADGTNGSNVFIDNSPTPIAVSAAGDARITTAGPKFGTGALALDGVGDHLLTATNLRFQFHTGSFTIELWIFPTTNGRAGGAEAVIDFRPDNTNGNFPQIFYGNYSDRRVIARTGTTDPFLSSTPLTINTWHHIAFVRSESATHLFVNGILQQSGTSNLSIPVCRPLIGANAFRLTAPLTFFTGRMDDIRVTSGIARYTSDFPVPTAAFPNS